jgi:hypothetical protein
MQGWTTRSFFRLLPAAPAFPAPRCCSRKQPAMVRISVLNDALKNMFNAEKRGKRQVLIRPSSKVVIKFLSVMQKHGMSLCPNLQSLNHRNDIAK